MKKYFLLSITFLTISLQCLAQTKPKSLNQAKWQQRVNYTIEVELNTDNQTLSAFESLVYTNNSPNALTEIYFHLWPNAYKNRTTAYAKQELENGNTDFHFAEPSERGFIDSLNFKVNGQPIKWELTEQIDIAKLTLNQPLAAGDSIIISTPFFVKIPKVFSRMGFENGHYCATQWYPKPAVYDVNGWNAMPYLNQGEFYSEFGSFDVQITLPKNILVAATGEVQDKREKEWWRARKQDINTPHYAPTNTKTLRFKQDNIHDFAWFAHKDYSVDFDTVILSNNQAVETWIFALTNFGSPKGIEFVNLGVKYYSDKVGNYPYSIAQAVITPLEAGAGMEYPTITNCGSIDKTTIIHELGHNWFYGILGSNEREHPWMDESINTYYEERSQVDLPKTKSNGLLGLEISQPNLLAYNAMRKNTDQAGNLRSEAYTDKNYGAIIYAKNPIGFKYLQHYLGTEKFDAMMQAYFEKWKFKHPLPNDFRIHAESFTQKDLSWFFDEVLANTKKMDYKVKIVSNNQLVVKNNGQLKTPFPITQFTNDSLKETQWIEGFKGKKRFTPTVLNFKTPEEAKNIYYRIDADEVTLDLYRQNNTAVQKGWCKTCSPIKIQPILNLEKSNTQQIFIAPVYGYNIYNKSMLGLSLYNSLIPRKKVEFILTPVYSFATNDINGYFSVWRNFNLKRGYNTIRIGLKSARFGTETFVNSNLGGLRYTEATFEKIELFGQFRVQPKNPRKNIEEIIGARYVMVNEQARGNGYYNNFGKDHYGIYELTYNFNRAHALYPNSFKIDMQTGFQATDFSRYTLTAKQSIAYSKHKKFAEVRFFAGGYASNSNNTSINSVGEGVNQRAMFTAGGTLGTNDYMYDEAMIGRNDRLPGFWAHQVLNRDAGFRNFVNLGTSDKWMTGLNLTIPFPLPVPIGFYGDMSLGSLSQTIAATNTPTNETKFNYIGGIYIQLLKDVAYIHIPLTQSDAISEAWNLNGVNTFFEKWSFTLNLRSIDPVNLLRNVKF
jgi:hypothetical protein